VTPPPGYVLIRPETLVALQKAVEAALGARAAECLVAGGLAGGARATAALEGPPQARVQRLLEAGRDIGWGDFALERLTPRQLIVTVGDSPFARVYGRAGAPVCHLTRGVLQTLASTVLEAPVAVAETACAAVGAERCRFETVEVGRDEASPPTPPGSRGMPPRCQSNRCSAACCTSASWSTTSSRACASGSGCSA